MKGELQPRQPPAAPRARHEPDGVRPASAALRLQLKRATFAEGEQRLAPVQMDEGPGGGMVCPAGVPPTVTSRSGTAPQCRPEPKEKKSSRRREGRSNPIVRVDGTGSDPVNQAVAAMAKGSLVERNTAIRLKGGLHQVAYIEWLEEPWYSDEYLANLGLSADVYVVLIEPWGKTPLPVQRNFGGFPVGKNFAGSNTMNARQWTDLLVHEINHIVNADDTKDPWEWYQGEFRARWVIRFTGIEDPVKRAHACRDDILCTYPRLKELYDKDSEFKKKVDAHLEPDASDNLTNALSSSELTAIGQGPQW